MKYTYVPKNKRIDGQPLEYTMTRTAFNEIASKRGDKKSNPYEFVMNYINDYYGLLGYVTSLIVEEH